MPRRTDHADRRSLASALRRRVVSSRVGIARRLQIRPPDPETFQLSIATVQPARSPAGHVLPNFGGIDWHPDHAVLRCLMELMERYCGAMGGIVREASNVDLECVLDTDSLGIFAPWQYDLPGFMFQPTRPDSPIRWTRGKSLVNGRECWVPMAWATVPFEPKTEFEVLFCSSSSGLAAGFSYRQALISALLELCERDAFMIMWHHRLSLPRITIDPCRLLGPLIVAMLRDEGAKIHFVDLTNDIGVPVALCALLRRWEGRIHLAVGTAAKASLAGACRKAFFEAVGESLRQRQLMSGRGTSASWQPANDFSNVTDFDRHPLVYNQPGMMDKVSFMWAGGGNYDLPKAEPIPRDERGLLAGIMQRVASRCKQVVALPMTSADVYALGVRVARVVAPGLCSINADHRYPHLGAPRIWDVAALAGVAVDPERRRIPNHLPHPLA